MWLNLRVEDQYRIDKIESVPLFFTHIGVLLSIGDVLVIGSYESRQDIAEWLNARHDESEMQRSGLNRIFEIYRENYPEGKAYHLRVTNEVLEYLSRISKGMCDFTEIGDHVAAYSSEFPEIVFHDAFSGNALYISGKVEEQKVKVFSQLMGVSFSRIHFVPGRSLP